MTSIVQILRLLIYEACVFIVCMYGDYFIGNSVSITGINIRLYKALVDSFTHGLVGFLSWAIIIDSRLVVTDITECSICMVLAMVVDIDHFIVAGSFQLKAALSLSSRPVFHASSLIPVIAFFIYATSVLLRDLRLKVFTFMFIVAWISHHIRDSTRRGLWFPPFGSTRPLPTTTYMFLIMFLPIVFKVMLYYTGFLEFDHQVHKWLSTVEKTDNNVIV